MMKISIIASLILATIPSVVSHYTFPRFIVNGTVTNPYQYVRNVAGESEYEGSKYNPQFNLSMLSTNITCGRLAFNFAKTTSTATVLAGSLVGFRTDPSYPIFHPGPAQAFLAKVDGALEDTIGDHENWYKIAYIGPVNESYWITYNARDVNFKIPETTPPGKYLLRIEHLWLHQYIETTQFYMNCAHIEVISAGAGTTPSDYVKFPGAYALDTPGLKVIRDMAQSPAAVSLFDYVPVVPLWTG